MKYRFVTIYGNESSGCFDTLYSPVLDLLPSFHSDVESQQELDCRMRDIDIRRALLHEMADLHTGEPDTLIIEELGLCQGAARVDIAVVNGSVHGYEIKSEQDTLARLPSQRDVYGRSLEFVTIVTCRAHVTKVREVVPRWWGIWSAVPGENGVRLKKARKCRRNPNVDPFALAQLLWRDEAVAVLAEHGLIEGFRSKPREDLWRRLAANLTVEQLTSVVRERLKRRGADWRAALSQA